MHDLKRHQLADGVEAVWAVPSSGFGHVADELPLPFLTRSGLEQTPRFGGEESELISGQLSLPAPYGYLDRPWPWQQRLFNLPRRRANIYWRNLFLSRCNPQRFFSFLE